MKKNIIWSYLFFLIFFSGCIEKSVFGGGGGLSIDVNYPKNIPQNTKTIKIDFVLSNIGKKTISNVNILVTEKYGLDIKKIECKGIKMNNGCKFNEIKDEEKIKAFFTFEIPKSYISVTKTIVQPEFEITYEYSDQIIWQIPIIKEINDEEKIPGEKLSLGDGPIKIDLKKEFDEEENKKNKINEGDIVSLIIKVIDNENSQTKIEKNNFLMKLENFEVYDFDSCSFSGSHILIPKDDIVLPQIQPMYCLVKAKILEKGWDLGKIEINTNYVYKIKKPLTITISPQ